MEPSAHFLDGAVDQTGRLLVIHAVRDHAGGGGDRDRDGLVPDLLHRIRLGHCDLVIRGPEAAGDGVGHLGLGPFGRLAGFGARMLDDFLGLRRDVLLLALELGEGRLGFLAQTPGLVQFVPDPFGPLVELVENEAVHAVIAEDEKEQHEADRHHDVAVVEDRHGALLSRAGPRRRP
jgi:hypothetical protein